MPLISGKYARSLAMALEIPMSPIAGGVFGHYIDVYFHTEPWFTGILALFGFIHSIVTIVRIVRMETQIPPGPPN
ncbi:MAG: AtpZ/AtpI family protein [Candidatus Binatus sp.]|uniref:AtpZ/AtpI family protein n=1 Tax=Candidatus Binatus sp. TaxID=2811406 RepID=UPI00271FFBF1|nr:AtpZ/AtpI family protein [Candidatus Binatus sp.]MDO8431942.1 AtpZ/AtpI family protein [Candidatus Binatus sp.]